MKNKIIAILLTIGLTANGAGYIKNSDIAATADIALSKLEPVAAGEVVIGNVTGDATHVPMSGQVTIDATGATVVSNAAVIGKVITGYVSGSGVLAASDSILQAIQKLDGNTTAGLGITQLTGEVTAGPGSGSQAATIANNAVTNAKILNGTIDLATKVTGILSNGNTSADSTSVANTIVSRDASGNFAAGTITAALAGNASTATALVANPSDCGAGTKAISTDASGNFTCTAVSLTADVAGVLPIANGGTNNSGAYTAGSILFSSGTAVSQDNTQLFWDNTNNYFGLGTATPAYRQHIVMATATSTDAIVWEGSGAGASRKWHWMPDSSGYLYMKNLNESYYSMTFTNAGLVGFGDSAPTAQFNVIPRTAATVVSKFKGAAAQTADLTQWQDSGSVIMASVDSTGKATLANAKVNGLTASLPIVTDASKNLASVSYATLLSSLGAVPLAGGTMTGLLTLEEVKETVVAGGTCSTSYNIDMATGSMFTLTLSGACALDVTNLAAGHSFSIRLTQSSTVAPTYAAKFKFSTAPSFSTSATKYDIISCVSFDGTRLECGAIINAQ